MPSIERPRPTARHRSRSVTPVRLLLTRRALEDPVHGQCGVCFESRRLQELVVLGADELAICRLCFESAAHFARLSGGHPLLFDLEQLP
jgi:hypothetical protein